MNARLMAGSLLAAGVLLAGCQSTIAGVPQPNAQNPTEPTFPTSRPSRTTSTTAPSAIPTPTPSATASAAPTPAEALTPHNGYAFIETKSGQTRCQISANNVGCEAQFTNAPTVNGSPANGVEVTADGQLRWIVGNLGDIPVVTIDYRTYTAEGWTILASEDGTRFTNDATGHGMFVAVQRVDSF
ncbi:hypothetical protein [Mycolicibacterium hodleri]|uniref:Lipoprotein LpqJ n=1 Tax=Mycolicibacterium hodleri TaxID=49897 RepID=A0A502E047_9MYCO|nr:hypothetical protein [Mycolicibacterium hodleri]TPG29901.1 hypothetical protein EAH80_25195 [Mycolicibacterium hodleri]